MKYTVIEWLENERIHRLKDENGDIAMIDIFVDGTLDRRYRKPKSLVGKTLSIERTHPYQLIAHKVKIIKSPPHRGIDR